MTFAEIARELGITEAGAKYICESAIKKLRRSEILRQHAGISGPIEPLRKRGIPKGYQFAKRDSGEPMPTCKHCDRKVKSRKSGICDKHYRDMRVFGVIDGARAYRRNPTTVPAYAQALEQREA